MGCPLCGEAHALSQCPRWRIPVRRTMVQMVCSIVVQRTDVVRDAPSMGAPMWGGRYFLGGVAMRGHRLSTLR